VNDEIDAIERLVHTVLYEGYVLYPYRPSALKNRKRFAFGAVYPRAWAERALEPALVRVEVVALGGATMTVAPTVRYLRLVRGGGAREESIGLAPRTLDNGGGVEHHIRDGLAFEIETTAIAADDTMWRFAIEVRNVTPIDAAIDHETVMDFVPASIHLVLRARRGGFASAIDPPARAATATAACRSSGLYPIIVAPGVVLASPIILPDYPEIARDSPGEFFDGTEIDEMLTLRVLTMTADEKREASAADPRVAALLARTDRLGIEATARLHGAVRTAWPREGARVRVRPGRNADAFDVLLAGKLATVARVERDLEGRVLCAVTIDDDPGADLGATGFPGHRFFFRPDELEVIA
jgi:hypothetical protein